MRIVRYLPLALLGLVVAAMFDRCGGPAIRSARAQVGTVHTETAPARPIAGLDLSKLPAGKVFGVTPVDERVRAALDEPAEFMLLDCQLGDFIEEVSKKHKIPVVLDLASLTADGKGPETLLNKKIRNTTLRGALRLLLDEQGLAYHIQEGIVILLTKIAAETKTTTRIYQVHDLVLRPNDPAGRPNFDSLYDLISSTIQAESWREAGGTSGEIKPFEGPGIIALVVTQTEDGHEQIEQLFANLRAAKLPAVLELQEKRERLVPASNQPATITLPAGATQSRAGRGGFF